MAYPIDFTGCKTMIFDSGKMQLLYQGQVSDFDRNEVRIAISGQVIDPMEYPWVSVLLVHQGDAYEFEGRVRRLHTVTEIALLRGSRKESRSARRYRVDAPAWITGVVVDQVERPFAQPLQVFVENISVNGMLLQSVPGFLQVGNVLRLCMDIGGKNTVITVRIVREAGTDERGKSYGCRVVFVE